MILQQAVDQFSHEIVERAEQAMTDAQMKKLKEWKTRLRLGQLNNLLGVALETDSPAVVVNWVRYQMGRRETNAGWGKSGLGQKVVNDIKALEEDATQVARDVFGEGPSSLQIRQAHIALVRRYAGYLKRWFVAKGGQ